MLKFIDSNLEPPSMRATTSDIWCHEPFLSISPAMLEQSFFYLKGKGYIVALELDPAMQTFVVTRITEKGRRAIKGQI